MQTTQCGAASERPERAFTINGALRPKMDISPGERQFWRIVNASPDLYADLELDSGPLEVVALDGMPLGYHDPSIRKRSMSHVLVPPAGRVEAIVTGPPADSHAALRSRCFDSGPDGDSNPAMVLADIVSAPPSNLQARPALGGAPVYATFSPTVLKRVEAREPQFVVNFTEDKQGFYINGQKFEMNAGPMLTVNIGSAAPLACNESNQRSASVSHTSSPLPGICRRRKSSERSSMGRYRECPLWQLCGPGYGFY
jgi:suppressor of ftsI